MRWNIQRGVVVIPKSVHKERIEQNIDVFGFELDNNDMASIATMDIRKSEIINHFTAATAKFLNGYKIHE